MNPAHHVHMKQHVGLAGAILLLVVSANKAASFSYTITLWKASEGALDTDTKASC